MKSAVRFLGDVWDKVGNIGCAWLIVGPYLVIAIINDYFKNGPSEALFIVPFILFTIFIIFSNSYNGPYK